MRRLPLIAVTAALAAGTIAGVADSATAAKPPSFTVQNVIVTVSEELPDGCQITLDWEISDPAAAEGYLVQANNTPLKGKNSVQGSMVTESTATYHVASGDPQYFKVTVLLVGGKSSKSWSVESESWTCS